ncbi:uncharacterized protein LOC124284191 [Haliotis rubra]|uniref:uncharacterized protein LOC124284191 n=1 Tax=Haliotis rubra TaxID=36100 RepID=UPI001EE5ADA5|nr:uncharacterized protein LOC124284191 [Haliotis rubra]
MSLSTKRDYGLHPVHMLQGGMYVFTMCDWYFIAIFFIFSGFLECTILGWVYGVNRVSEDIELMTGKPAPLFFKIAWRFYHAHNSSDNIHCHPCSVQTSKIRQLCLSGLRCYYWLVPSNHSMHPFGSDDVYNNLENGGKLSAETQEVPAARQFLGSSSC